MKTVETTDLSKKQTTVGQLIKRLNEYPKSTIVDSFEMVYVDGRGYKCNMWFNVNNYK